MALVLEDMEDMVLEALDMALAMEDMDLEDCMEAMGWEVMDWDCGKDQQILSLRLKQKLDLAMVCMEVMVLEVSMGAMEDSMVAMVLEDMALALEVFMVMDFMEATFGDNK